jgi:branched-chain amino acid transport system ATP-binding protein
MTADPSPSPSSTSFASPASSESSSPGAEPILRLRGITKRFSGIIAVRDVDLDVYPGQVHGLIGPNGAGKTTLFDMIAGIQVPSSGTIELDGRDVTRTGSVHRARAGVRRTFQRQQPIGLLSVEDNVLAALDWHGGRGGAAADLLGLPGRRRLDRERREEVSRVLDQFGLADVGSTAAGSLPIGATRLLEFARAIVDRPRLLLLDEPTSGLSESEADRIQASIAEQRAAGCAVVLVEHDVGFVMASSDHITVMDLGSVIASGTPEEIRSSQLVRDAYLG